MKFTKIIVTTALFFYPQYLIAGWQIDGTQTMRNQQKNVTSTSTQYIDVKRSRVEIKQPPITFESQGKKITMNNTSTLFFDGQFMVQCMHSSKTCTKKAFTGANSISSMLDDMPIDGKHETTLVDNGPIKTVAGVKCKPMINRSKMTSNFGNKPIVVAHESRDCYFNLGSEYVNACKDFNRKFRSASKTEIKMDEKFCELGVAVESSVKGDAKGDGASSYRATKVQQKSFPASLFQYPPSGFTMSKDRDPMAGNLPPELQEMMKFLDKDGNMKMPPGPGKSGKKAH